MGWGEQGELVLFVSDGFKPDGVLKPQQETPPLKARPETYHNSSRSSEITRLEFCIPSGVCTSDFPLIDLEFAVLLIDA